MTEKGNTMAGLTSLPRKMNIKGQPHKLAYITEAESDLLKSRGGAGKPRKGTKGVPSYDFGDIGVDDYDVMGLDAQAEADAAQEAADAAFDDADMGQDFDLMNQAAQEAAADQTTAQQLDEAEATNIDALIDQLALSNQLGQLSSIARGTTAEEQANALQDAMMGRGTIGYNQAVDAGYPSLIEQSLRESDLATARGIEGLYGLREGQVTPAPVGGFSYQGPGSTKAAATEIGRGAATLAANLVEMYPSPLNILATIAREEFDVKIPSLNLTDKGTGYFDSLTESQREANIAARGEAPPTISEQVAPTPQSSVDYFDVPPSQPQSSVDYFDALIDTTPTPSTAEDFYGGIPDGNEIIPRIIPETPTATPVVEKEEVDIATATPRTRTPATDTFNILAGIYGPDVAAKLLPTRIV